MFHYSGFFSHPDWVSAASHFGWTGVDLFFVLSGYLIASELFQTIRAGSNVSLPVFFTKRLFRIMPPFLLVVAAYFSIPAARERDTIGPLWKYLTFTQNFGLELRSAATFSHAWSLCIEEQFYLLLPLILFMLVKSGRLNYGKYLLIFLFIAGFMIRWLCMHYFVDPYQNTDEFGLQWYKWEYYPTFTRLDGLLTGVAIAAIFQYRPKWRDRIERNGNWMIAVSLAMFLIAWLSFDEHSFGATIFGFPMVDISYGFLVMGAISPGSIMFRWGPKPVVRVATFSYVIYLTHKSIIHLVQSALGGSGIAKDGNLMLLICAALCILAAFVINIVIEKPALALRNKVLSSLSLRVSLASSREIKRS